MKFETGDIVRVKSKKSCIGNYVDHTYKRYFTFKDVNHIENDKGIFVFENSEDLQLILELPKLKLRLSQRGLKLKVKILEQNENLRGNLELSTHINGIKYYLCSVSYPELYHNVLKLNGSDNNRDNNKISYEYKSQEELDEFVSALRVMMKDERLQ